MIQHLKLLRQIGQFDAVDAGGQLPFAKLTLVYAENGRGKTTMAAIFRSLKTGDASLIAERHRLAATNPPHVVLSVDGPPPYVFQTGAWSAVLPDICIFDDVFVAENICSGIEVATQHRQKLHELIIGAQGVALNSALQGSIDRIEKHNQTLRMKADTIPAARRGPHSVDAFCALEPVADISQAIREAEQTLAAAQSADAVQREPPFTRLELPAFDVPSLNKFLERGLPELDREAAARVQTHIQRLGPGGENWVGDGIQRIAAVSEGQVHEVCPFCAQDLSVSPLIDHYRAYFSEGYANLRRDIAAQSSAISAAHGGDMPAAFERNFRIMEQRRTFWAAFTSVPEILLDTAGIARAWKAARELVAAALDAKQTAPLDRMSLSSAATDAIAAYDAARAGVEAASTAVTSVNEKIAVIKEQAAVANIPVLTADLAKLRAIEARFDPAIASLCQGYFDEKSEKAQTETQRQNARDALDQYRQRVFPAYETAINGYLQKFGAGFRLGSVASVNNRGGSACNYNVMINNVPISLTAAAGDPSFRNTLSAGDRNTLALAFFFASLDSDPPLSEKIVVIDDPMTSLDEHRSLTTVQEIRRLVDRVKQVIVLSHSKPFLCELWGGADRIDRAAIRITRGGNGSGLAAWDVRQDSITEHDKRHEKVAAYINASDPAQERAVAVALRPILESFIRVAYPIDFPPGSLLGPFIGICQQRVGEPNQLLAAGDVNELRDLLDYANKFHHDTNAAWETELINDQQLVAFCRRTLAFARRA